MRNLLLASVVVLLASVSCNAACTDIFVRFYWATSDTGVHLKQSGDGSYRDTTGAYTLANEKTGLTLRDNNGNVWTRTGVACDTGTGFTLTTTGKNTPVRVIVTEAVTK